MTFLRCSLLAIVFALLGSSVIAEQGVSASEALKAVTCPGTYSGHLQGVCRDSAGNLYWSFTTEIVKTDAAGQLLKHVSAPTHQGDLCWHDGKLYVAVNLGKFNRPAGEAKSWVFVYDDQTLQELARHEVPEVVHGAGGMEYLNGKFYVVGGLPGDHEENYVYEYDPEFRFIKRYELKSGQTLMGIQTVAYADGIWWFGCYGKPAVTMKADTQFNFVEKFEFPAALGIVPVGKNQFLIGRDRADAQKRHTGSLVPATINEQGHLVEVRPTKTSASK